LDFRIPDFHISMSVACHLSRTWQDDHDSSDSDLEDPMLTMDNVAGKLRKMGNFATGKRWGFVFWF